MSDPGFRYEDLPVFDAFEKVSDPSVFTPLPDEAALVDAGILAAPMDELDRRWRATIAPIFATLDLPMPPEARDAERGRLDHGEAFRWLWSEFTSVRQAEPGVTW